MSISNFLFKIESDRSKLTVIGLSLVVAALLIRLIFSWISLANLPVTSDEASSVLLAKMILRGELPLLFVGQPYQFPIESYLMAPFVEWMPRTAFGARYQTLILGLTAFLGFFMIARTAFSTGSRWPALLLICFPSAYFLMYQAAYAPPQYSMSLTLAWVSIFAVLRSRQSARPYLFLMTAGFCCGLAVSNHLLTITISAGVFALVLCSGSVRQSLRGAAVFALCCLVGTLPYILALWLVPGAYGNLPISMEIVDALRRMIAPALTMTLPGAMGVNPFLFPDFGGHINWPASLRSVFAVFYVTLLLALIVQRIKVFSLTISGRRWPRLELVDLALIASLLTIWVFASHRTGPNAYRYMLPAVWCFPFLVGHAFQSFTGWHRTAAGTAAVCLALFNIGVSIQVISEWSDSKQLQNFTGTPAIDELIDTLNERNITHCYASFWLAYRITFETDEKVVCSLPFNERFPLWPIPYKQQVDNQTDAVYILTNNFRPRLSAAIFEQHLAASGITAEKTRLNPFLIYQNFKIPTYLPSREYVLGMKNISIQTNGGNSPALARLADKDFSTAWLGSEYQANGQWVALTFDSKKTINGITIFHPQRKSRRPESFKIDGYKTVDGLGAWHQLAGPVNVKTERLRFVNNHPVYRGLSQQLRFDPVEVEALRIIVDEPNKESKWGLTEIEVSTLNDHQQP